MQDRKATCVAFSNIALIKYWGNRNDTLRLPMTNSIGFALDSVYTTTTVEFADGQPADEIEIDGGAVSGAARERTIHHLDLLRRLAGSAARARVVSRNNFPMGAGIASSASGFAALTCAAAWALGLDLPERELSRLARRGSGSAARSVPGGFVEWYAADTDAGSFAETIAPPEHWPLRFAVAVVSHGEKPVGSTEGHRLAHTSPLYAARLVQVEEDIPQMRESLMQRAFHAVGSIAEADCLSMHAVMLTSAPSLLYWTPETVAVMHAVRAWRAGGLECYFTIDAGPNVIVITTEQSAAETAQRLHVLPGVHTVLTAGVGGAARRAAESLF
ncbi:MAG: diphosphomevalonate decarboxylase [Chloroflexi bacterium]|nr:diphosphomevalonate decarboxylase [Chloroflexota bacterium]